MTYDGFVNQLLELKPELKSIKAIGTDGEEALFNAFVKKTTILSIFAVFFMRDRT